MNSAHDLGGVAGFGPIAPEPENEEPLFHAEWEKTAFGLTLAAGFLGQWNIDISRFSRERQHPVTYLTSSYYENWINGLETLLMEAQLIDSEELKSASASNPASLELQAKCVQPDQVEAILAKGGPADLETDQVKLFQQGDRVRVKLYHTNGHTRAPQYIRGHVGTIHEYYGSHVLPDESAKGNRVGSHLYNVAFDGHELWGNDEVSKVHLDLWQDYLERVTE